MKPPKANHSQAMSYSTKRQEQIPSAGMTHLLWATFLCFHISACDTAKPPDPPQRSEQTVKGPVYATPGDQLQPLLNLAARATEDRRLILRPGLYSPMRSSFCILGLTAEHEGVTLEGIDGAVLSGISSEIEPVNRVSHVIYCGHGLTSNTVIRNLKVINARGHVTKVGVPKENFGAQGRYLQTGMFFHLDGGALKIFGMSSPTIDRCSFEGNQTRLCGGAVSIEQQGLRRAPATFRNCVFLNNKCPATGSAVDVLQGSSVVLQNCLFVGNIGNYGMDQIRKEFGLSYNEKHGSGALTVFPDSKALVSHCTFTQNWNAVDDHGEDSSYSRCIFSGNDKSDGSRPGHAYEIDIPDGDSVKDCVFFSDHPDLQGDISRINNRFLDTPVQFDEEYSPVAPELKDIGYRPQLH